MPTRAKRVSGNREDKLIVDALMTFFQVTPIEVGSERLWPSRAIQSAGAVLNILPPDVRQELSAAVSHEYVQKEGERTGFRIAGPAPVPASWLPDAKEFAAARFRFHMETGA